MIAAAPPADPDGPTRGAERPPTESSAAAERSESRAEPSLLRAAPADTCYGAVMGEVRPFDGAPDTLERLGYAVRRQALAGEALTAVQAAFDEALAVGIPAGVADALWLPLQRRLLSDRRVLRPARGAIMEWLSPLVGPLVPHCGDICRIAAPGHATLPHQDAYYGGHAAALTVWVAIEDIPLERGPLVLWPGSHRRGRFVHGPGSSGILSLPTDVCWHGGDLAAGDAIVFLADTVHATLPNRGLTVRRSVDYRFWPA